MSSEDSSSGCGCGCGCVGCLSWVLVFLVFWALLFGVTVGSQHYGISCSTSQGVVLGSHPQ